MVSELLGNPLDFATNADAVNSLFQNSIKVRMPFPEIPTGDASNSDLFELKTSEGLKIYSEWGFPQDKIDEQFYIAMRWPYKMSTKNDSIISSFKKYYFDDKEEFIGTAEDYKNQHILIYNPSGNSGKGSAVVCKPAYFMWGKNDTKEASRYSPGNDFGPGYEERNLSAVVSPDAAYYLGILTTPNRGLDEKGNYSDDAVR